MSVAPGAGRTPVAARRAGHAARAGVLLAAAATAGLLGPVASKPVAPRAPGALPLVATHALSVPEPSDLAIDETGTRLWTVTNHPARVYQLDTDGNLVKPLRFEGQDLEAVAYDRSDHTLWVAEERRREIVHLDLDGEVLARHPLDLAGDRNSGIEGLCLDDQGRMFALNEKRPGLFLELDRQAGIAARREVRFAQDYSGITYDRARRCFWIVSDKSQQVFLWDRKDGVLKAYPLPYPKAEGVAVDDAAKRLYIVSDSEQKLFVYRLGD